MLLQQLIRIPSVNPENAAGAQSDTTHEQALADFLANWLTDIGASVTLEEIRPLRPNLIARFAPLDGRPRILFGPHLDTVGVEGMTIDPFSGEISEGRIWGRGASDTKGSMAAMLEALQENKDILPTLPTAIDFVAFMGEESNQWGSKHFATNHGHLYQFAIIGEPTSMDIVHTTKGSLWATLTASGTAAHSSQPHLGDNAILKLTRALHSLQEKLDAVLQGYTHPVLGRSTLNIGTISGGTRPNIVPDCAQAEIDIRQTPSLLAAGGATALLKQIIADLHLPLEIKYAHENPPMETDPGHPFIKQLLAIDPRTSLAGAPWFSDAAHLSAAGIPSVCLGPGSIDQAHTKNEFLDLGLLKESARYFSKFIRSLQNSPVE
ncbi:MAG: M20 family metallopeptidase [Armatimonadetes bacterium]|nr:M20 family metallopeptidase [Akkermansiaceae bacterium]